ncbi:hypothetical protein IAR50_006395 [Cryptococcus sp. DSM 104548]
MDFDDLAVDNGYQLGGADDERERAQNAAIIEELERKKRLRKLAVPTDDKKVRERLRAYGEPITLFGEGPGDRRDRLKYVQEQMEQAKGGGGMIVDSDDESSDSEGEEEEFYEGSNDLLQARRKMAKYSVLRAKDRVARQRKEYSLPLGKFVNHRKAIFKELQTFNNLGSQHGDDRPLSTIRFSPNSKYVLTTSWTGATKVWDMPNLNPICTKRGHEEKLGGAAWYPFAGLENGWTDDSLAFATGGGEGDVKLWSMNGEKSIGTLKGHTSRVGRMAFHPSGEYLASAGFDGTWRLWDAQKQKELMIQEGHSKEVYALGFQDDGALIASGGFDAIGRVWDLRTGRTIMILDGHVKELLAMDFAPNGYQIATGSGDDTVRIWDLRALKTQYIIPAHKSSVSDVRFFRDAGERKLLGMGPDGQGVEKTQGGKDVVEGPADGMDVDASHDQPEADGDDVNPSRSGTFLLTAGFDNTVRIWSADEWNLVRNLSTDAGKVMSADISGDGKFVASASYSRSFHLFGGDSSL